MLSTVFIAGLVVGLGLLSGCTFASMSGFAGSCQGSGKGYPNRVLRMVSYSPNGGLLAVGYHGCNGGELELWDTNNFQKQPVIFHVGTRRVESLSYSPDGKWLAFGGDDDSSVRLVNTSNLQSNPILLSGHNYGVRSIAFGPDNQTLATLDLEHTLKMWDLDKPDKPTKAIPGFGSLTNDIAISSDGKNLVASSYSLTDIELWTLPNLKPPPHKLKGILNPETRPVFTSDGRYMAIGASSANVHSSLPGASMKPAVELWDMTNPKATPTLLTGQGGQSVGGVAFSPDGKWLADTRVDIDLVQVWDMTNLNAPAQLLPHNAAYSVTFSPDGKTLASGSMYNSILLWDYKQPSPLPTIVADPP